jgi:hypothetical protein
MRSASHPLYGQAPLRPFPPPQLHDKRVHFRPRFLAQLWIDRLFLLLFLYFKQSPCLITVRRMLASRLRISELACRSEMQWLRKHELGQDSTSQRAMPHFDIHLQRLSLKPTQNNLVSLVVWLLRHEGLGEIPYTRKSMGAAHAKR